MLRVIIGVTLCVLGVYGLFLYHEGLWVSGGPDGNRNPIQYYMPYMITSVVIAAGFYQIIKAYKRKRKKNA